MRVLVWLSLLPMLACAATPAATVAANAEVVPEAVVVDYGCHSDRDCVVKNVGNCCGYYPACVNKDSPTDPAGVEAQCEREGRMAICGFREISACVCDAGTCEAAAAGVAEPLVQ